MWTHEVKLEKYEATTPGGGPLQLGTAESQGNEFLHIKAGEGWEGLAIKVVFRPCKVSRMVPKDGNNIVDVPWEATKEPLTAAKGRIVFRGLDEGGRVMNSLDLPYEVKGHSPTGDRDENKYTPSAVDQIIAETKADAEAADLSAKAAAAAQKAAEDGAAAALQSAKDSAGSALRASYAESEAEKSRLAAAGSADAAAGSAQQAADAVQKVKEAGQQATEDVGTAQTNAVQAVQKAQTAAVQAVQGQQQTSVGAVQAAGTEAVGQVTQASQQQILAVEKAGKTQINNVAEAGSARIEAVEKALEQAGQQATEAIGTAQSDAIKAVGDAQSAAVQAVQGQQQTSVGAVQAAGTAAVDQVSRAGQQQIQAVKDEGTAQIGAVAEAGSAQVQAVQQVGSQQITDIGEAGAQQVQAVNSAGDTKLDQINTAIAHPPQPNTSTGFWQVWNAETGQYEDTTALYQGGYYTPSVAEDGTLTWTGSQAGMPELPSANIRGPQGLGVPTPSADAAGQVPTVNDTGDGYLLTGPYAPLEASIRPTANGNPAVCENSVAWNFQGLKVYGKSTQDGTPSPNNPVPIISAGEGGSVELNILGQNVLSKWRLNGSTVWNQPVETKFGWIETDFKIQSGQTYYVAFAKNGIFMPSNNDECYANTVASSTGGVDDARSGKFVATKTGPLFLRVGDSANIAVYSDFEVALTPIYNYSEYVSQSLLLSTPSGLPGIPVNSGGNYTDASGQQWRANYKSYADLQAVSPVRTLTITQAVAARRTVNFNNINFSFSIVDAQAAATGTKNDSFAFCNIALWDDSAGVSFDAKLTVSARCYVWGNSAYLQFPPESAINSQEALQSWIDTNGPIVFIYPLATPITTPLSDEEVAAYRALTTYSGTTVVSTAEPVAGIEARYILDGTAAWNKVTTALSAMNKIYASYEDLSGAIREGVNTTTE